MVRLERFATRLAIAIAAGKEILAIHHGHHPAQPAKPIKGITKNQATNPPSYAKKQNKIGQHSRKCKLKTRKSAIHRRQKISTPSNKKIIIRSSKAWRTQFSLLGRSSSSYLSTLESVFTTEINKFHADIDNAQNAIDKLESYEAEFQQPTTTTITSSDDFIVINVLTEGELALNPILLNFENILDKLEALDERIEILECESIDETDLTMM